MKPPTLLRRLRDGLLGARDRDPDRVVEPDPRLVGPAIALFRALKPYFRAEVHGLDNLPEGAALLVANHNAGITSLEPFFLGLECYKRNGELLYYLGHDAMVSLPVVGDLLTGVGTIRASHTAAGRAFAAGRKVVAFPGGNYEAFRPFSQRHRVDLAGRTGFVRLAIAHRVPILPVLCLGGHETFFVLTRGKRLASALGVKRALRSDSFPVFLGAPWGVGIGPLFHLPLPSKLLVEVGEPIELGHLTDADGEDREELARIRDLVQGRLQEMMDRRAAERRWPLLG